MVDWKQDSINVAIGYLVSWIYVLAVVSFFQKLFGTTKGVLVAYISSFLVWYAVLYGLNLRNPAYTD
jgi:hypothetical protein